ncbi:MAG: CBS domain-containing protein [Sandaracinaceae bacterium]|nr:CBS domain-containing protein [Sandaracinaceae bacterium]
MHVVATHENADFDALAACVAVQKLEPGALIALPRRLSRAVREYWSLHKDRFAAARASDVDPATVDRLTVVDLRDRRRLGHVEAILARRDAGEEVTLAVYDHHPATPTDLSGDVHVVEPLGAVTTALVERIRSRQVPIDPAEATLLALGIHQDTGSLTLGHTTPRDARAFAWLLDHGADLAVMERYLQLPLADAQLAALSAVLHGARRERVGAVEVGIATLAIEEMFDGLAEITAEARRLGGFDALITFTAVGRRGAVQVVGRSRSALVDIGGALRALGGGGHRGAAAALVKDDTPDAVAGRALAWLHAHPPSPRVVAEVMTTPVHTVAASATLAAVAEQLAEWGVSGAPVERDGELIAVLSHRDIDRARAKGRGELPVTSHMSGSLRTTRPDAPLEDALACMVEHDVGRLPVLDAQGALVGIVTRTDVRRALYANAAR